jgi:hypothetical protein
VIYPRTIATPVTSGCNLHTANCYGQPLGVRCRSCERRALMPLNRVGAIKDNMTPLQLREWQLGCGGDQRRSIAGGPISRGGQAARGAPRPGVGAERRACDEADAIARRNAELLLELDFTPDRILREIAKVAAVNTADFVTIDEQGQPHIDMSGVKRRHLAAIASVENTDKGVKYKAHDKLKALDMLAKMARMYPADRTELSGPNGAPIQSASVNVNHTMDIAALEPEQRDQLRQVLLAIKAKHERDSEEQATSS